MCLRDILLEKTLEVLFAMWSVYGVDFCKIYETHKITEEENVANRLRVFTLTKSDGNGGKKREKGEWYSVNI